MRVGDTFVAILVLLSLIIGSIFFLVKAPSSPWGTPGDVPVPGTPTVEAPRQIAGLFERQFQRADGLCYTIYRAQRVSNELWEGPHSCH